jgi:hypothetical protein
MSGVASGGSSNKGAIDVKEIMSRGAISVLYNIQYMVRVGQDRIWDSVPSKKHFIAILTFPAPQK